MHKHGYHLIFSRIDGELRVVSELACSCSHQPAQRRGIGAPCLWTTLRRPVWLLGLALFAGPAVADGIVADGAAAAGQRPQVIATPSGLAQVNIAAPNQAGVSHNQYQQFDVNQQGAILNNSAVMTATQLAGMIPGNPNLNANSAAAQVILNEVNSINPSQLRGLMEVAGGRAQVIVANPAGMICNGCGTINAGRMTLTTGKAQLNADGSLAGYRTERGVVRIEGRGLNGDPRHDTEYVDVLARAVAVNGGVWAKKELTLVAGRNAVSADGRQIDAQGADGSAPQLAIDMGQMGGMYSGHIRMIGTEAGVGVRNQGGDLQAEKTLSISSEGQLVWQSGAQEAVTQAGGDISLTARDGIEHHGRLHSGGTLSADSRRGGLKQSGTLAATGDVQLKAERDMYSSGHLLAGSDANSRLIRAADLTLTSQGEIRASGSLLSRKDLSLHGQRVDISQSQLAADRATLSAQSGGVALRQAKIDSGRLTIHTVGDIDAQQAQVKAVQWDVTGNNLFSQQAIWSQSDGAESRFTLNGVLNNSDGIIEACQLALSVGDLINQRGQLTGQGDLSLSASQGLDNQRGLVEAGGQLTIYTDGDGWDNRGATVQAGEGMTLTARGLDNEAGTLFSFRQLTLIASAAVNNHHGAISAETLDLTAQRLDNPEGKVIAVQGLKLSTHQALDNSHGLLEAGHALRVNTGGDWDNPGGAAQGGSQVNVTTRSLNNASGRLQSGGEMTLDSTGDISNQRGVLSAQQGLSWQGGTGSGFDNDGGSLQSDGDLSLRGGQLTNRQQGVVLSQQALALHLVGAWDNQQGTVTGKGRTTVRAADLHNAQGVVNALAGLDMQFTNRLDNGSGRIFSKRSQTLQAQHIANTHGWMGSRGGWSAVTEDIDNREGSIQSQQGVTLSAGMLDNTGGTLRSNGDQHIDARQVDNRQGVISSHAALTLTAAQLENGGGTLIGQGSGVYRAETLNNQHGRMHSGDALTIKAIRVDNRTGQLVSARAFTLNADRLDNSRQGVISSQTGLEVQAERLNNRDGGRVLGSTHLGVTARAVDNHAGRLQSAGSLALAGLTTLDNGQGRIQANGDLRINADAAHAVSALALLNPGGQVQSGATLALNTRTLDNQGGTLQSRQALTLAVQQDYTQRAGDILSSNGALTLSVAGTLSNLSDWLLPGSLTVNSHHLNNQGLLVANTLQLATGRLFNPGRLEADRITLDVDTMDNPGSVMGDDITVRARLIDNHGRGAVMAATGALHLQAGERMTQRDGALLYSGGDIDPGRRDRIENRASFIAADPDVTVETRRPDRLRAELESEHGAEKNDDSWQRDNGYWRSYDPAVNSDSSSMAAAARQLTFRDDAAAHNNRYGTLLAMDINGRRAQVRVMDNRGQLTDLWISGLALTPGTEGGDALTFYETPGWSQNTVPAPVTIPSDVNMISGRSTNGTLSVMAVSTVLPWLPAITTFVNAAPALRSAATNGCQRDKGHIFWPLAIWHCTSANGCLMTPASLRRTLI